MIFPKSILSSVLAALALVPGCAPASQRLASAPVAAFAPASIGVGREDSVVAGARGIVSAADPRAAEAGAQMLRQGGSATDAAIATMLALTVVEPQSSGIGGGGFLVLGDARGAVETIDGREAAPAAANPQWFFVDGQPLPIQQAIPGGRSVGIPGSLRLAAMAHGKHGKLAWAKLFQPAIQLARNGFAVTPRLAMMLGRFPGTGALDPAGRALFYDADGQPLPVGTVIHNPALADTLEAIARHGAEAFYGGENARTIAAKVSASPRNPAPMTVTDIAAYQAKARAPVCGHYREYRVCGMGPPSSGAQLVIAILGQLERFDLKALGPDSATSWHLLAESERLAYADRDRYLADPDFVSVPIAGLTDPAYLAGRSALISPGTALPSVMAGTPPQASARFAPAASQPENGTTHFIAIDRQGNVASYTSTVESAFGSGLMAGGYFLNNELTDFNLAPDQDGMPTANRVEGGKRPRSSMAPTLVYGPDGRLRLAVGAAGGATIPAQVVRTIIGVLDWGLPAHQAIALPVLFAPGGNAVFVEQGSRLEAMIPALVALGHAQVTARDMPLKTNAVERAGDRWRGAADPRSEGAAIGE